MSRRKPVPVSSPNRLPYGAGLVQTVRNAVDQPVREVQIRSQILPTIRYRPGGEQRKPTPLEKLVLSIVRPAITVDTAWQAYDWEPYGAPEKNYRWVLPTLGALAAVGVLASTAYLARRI